MQDAVTTTVDVETEEVSAVLKKISLNIIMMEEAVDAVVLVDVMILAHSMMETDTMMNLNAVTMTMTTSTLLIKGFIMHH